MVDGRGEAKQIFTDRSYLSYKFRFSMRVKQKMSECWGDLILTSGGPMQEEKGLVVGQK